MARIMVVEDEPITAMDLEQMLVAIGHEVAGWSDAGEEAVEKARALSPDLVLMDIRLQGEMTGIEAADRIREEARSHGSSTPVVFLTAFADKETVDRACRTSPYGYLVKPFTERSVAAAVQVALTRVEEEKGVLDRERFLSSALSSLGEALLAIDAEGRIRFANIHALELLGVSEKEFLDSDARGAVRLLDDERGEPLDAVDVALTEGRITSSKARLVGAEGLERFVELSAAPMISPEGETLGAILAFREARRGKSEPSPSEARLEAERALTDRLEHEISNPLTYNLGALSVALREVDALRATRSLEVRGSSEERVKEEATLERIELLLRSAQEGASRVASVMREFRSSSFLELGPVPVQPIEILELAVGACSGELEDVRLVRSAGPAPTVRGNKWQLARLLADELRLAVASLTESGESRATLEIHTGTDVRGYAEARLSIRARPLDARAPREERGEKLAPREISEREVIAAHGGELMIRRGPDARELALFLPPLRARDPRAEEARPSAGQRGCVLVVDDEPMIGRVLELILAPHHDVVVVDSAERALALVERGDAFDVILSDISMPDMSGRELYEHLKKTRPEVADRIIVMSGGSSDEKEAEFFESMKGRRLDKPFRVDQLVPLIAERMNAAPVDVVDG
jgi:PAS domain S-box-containing protein